MGAVLAERKGVTVAELEREGGPDGRWELIDGKLVEMNASSPRASKVGARFVTHLSNHVDGRGLGDVFGADAGFVVFSGREMIRVPDAAFVAAERLPPADEAGFYRLAPDIVVEVVSPSDRASDVLAKAMMWLDAGSRQVWVADPATKTVAVYTPDRNGRVLRENDSLDGGDVLPEFRLSLATLFA